MDKKEVRLSGSYAAMAGALAMSTKPGQLPRVPSFVPVWLPRADSKLLNSSCHKSVEIQIDVIGFRELIKAERAYPSGG
jgi:hypothetical protein